MTSGTVSFCLFGKDPDDIYYEGAAAQAHLYKRDYPSWELWFYVGESVPDAALTEIREANPRVKIQFMDGPEDQTATWWRYDAIKHCQSDVLLFRDVDSRLCEREKKAVDEWIESEYTFHVIRDHEYHGVKLLAGLWGLKRPAYPLLSLSDTIKGDYYQTDQDQLVRQVWGVARRRIMAHLGCYHTYERQSQRRPLIEPRRNGDFVAQGFYADGTLRHPEHRGLYPSDTDLRKNPNLFPVEYRDV